MRNIDNMTIEEIQKEAKNITKAYPNNKDIPAQTYQRLCILITEYKRREAIELSAKEKVEKAEYETKLTEARILAFRTRFDLENIHKNRNK